MIAEQSGDGLMSSKITVIAISFAVLVAANPALAEDPAKVPRIAYFAAASAEAQKPRLAAFRQGLRELGYSVGKNILIEERYARRREQRAKLAAGIVASGVDVIVAQGAAARAAKKATDSIPIAMIQSDPVGTGLVKSLAHPGGNVTGLASQPPSLVAKRLQILKEAVPAVSRIAVLALSSSAPHRIQIKHLRTAAPSMGLSLVFFEVRGRKGFDRAFAAIRKEKPDGLVVLANSLFRTYHARIIRFAANVQLPAIYPSSRWVKWGGVMSYGSNFPDLCRRLALYVDKILKRAKPADLPVELPTKFDLVLNMKTARSLGISFPKSILLQASQMIE